jgi:hypothetical protein
VHASVSGRECGSECTREYTCKRTRESVRVRVSVNVSVSESASACALGMRGGCCLEGPSSSEGEGRATERSCVDWRVASIPREEDWGGGVAFVIVSYCYCDILLTTLAHTPTREKQHMRMSATETHRCC